MATGITHIYTSPIADGTVTSLVRPSNWNSAHTFDFNMASWFHNSAAMYSSTTFNMINATASIVRMDIPNWLKFTRVDVPVSISTASSATTNTAAIDISVVGVLYTRNASTLNAIVGASMTTTYTWASNSGVASSLTGPRFISLALASTISPGEYYYGFQISSHSGSSIGLSTTALSMTIAPVVATSYTVVPFLDMSVSSAVSVDAMHPMQGLNSVTISATSQTHQASQITINDTAGLRGNLMVIFRNAV